MGRHLWLCGINSRGEDGQGEVHRLNSFYTSPRSRTHITARFFFPRKLVGYGH